MRVVGCAVLASSMTLLWCDSSPLGSPTRPPLPNADADAAPFPPADAAADTSVVADTGTDAPIAADGPRCSPTAAFGKPRRLDELSDGVANEWSMRVSDDEQLAIFTRQDSGGQRIWTATRGSRDGAFSSPKIVDGPWVDAGGPSTALAGDPMLGVLSGQPTLFFSENAGTNFDILYAPWNAQSRSAGAATPVEASGSSEVAPYFLDATSELWFLRDGADGMRLYRSVVTGTAFATPERDAVLAAAGTYTRNGTITFTNGGLTAWFGADLGGGADIDVYRADRTSAQAAFGTPSPVTELGTTSFEQPLTVTPDGCRMYFASNRDVGFGTSIDLFVAQRGF